jgi:hypothetical protein
MERRKHRLVDTNLDRYIGRHEQELETSMRRMSSCSVALASLLEEANEALAAEQAAATAAKRKRRASYLSNTSSSSPMASGPGPGPSSIRRGSQLSTASSYSAITSVGASTSGTRRSTATSTFSIAVSQIPSPSVSDHHIASAAVSEADTTTAAAAAAAARAANMHQNDYDIIPDGYITHEHEKIQELVRPVVDNVRHWKAYLSSFPRREETRRCCRSVQPNAPVRKTASAIAAEAKIQECKARRRSSIMSAIRAVALANDDRPTSAVPSGSKSLSRRAMPVAASSKHDSVAANQQPVPVPMAQCEICEYSFVEAELVNTNVGMQQFFEKWAWYNESRAPYMATSPSKSETHTPKSSVRLYEFLRMECGTTATAPPVRLGQSCVKCATGVRKQTNQLRRSFAHAPAPPVEAATATQTTDAKEATTESKTAPQLLLTIDAIEDRLSDAYADAIVRAAKSNGTSPQPDSKMTESKSTECQNAEHACNASAPSQSASPTSSPKIATIPFSRQRVCTQAEREAVMHPTTSLLNLMLDTYSPLCTRDRVHALTSPSGAHDLDPKAHDWQHALRSDVPAGRTLTRKKPVAKSILSDWTVDYAPDFSRSNGHELHAAVKHSHRKELPRSHSKHSKSTPSIPVRPSLSVQEKNKAISQRYRQSKTKITSWRSSRRHPESASKCTQLHCRAKPDPFLYKKLAQADQLEQGRIHRKHMKYVLFDRTDPEFGPAIESHVIDVCAPKSPGSVPQDAMLADMTANDEVIESVAEQLQRVICDGKAFEDDDVDALSAEIRSRLHHLSSSCVSHAITKRNKTRPNKKKTNKAVKKTKQKALSNVDALGRKKRQCSIKSLLKKYDKQNAVLML